MTPQTILITGADTGIGYRTAEYLASKGHHIYAGVLQQNKMETLNAMENVEALHLDVTRQDDIDAAIDKINDADRGLHALFNNAGVAIMAPLIDLEESDLEFQLNVNLFGPYRMVKACAPLLIKSKGRIVNISSVSGICAVPFLGPYNMSKFALEGFNDALAQEMALLGVRVIAVEPGDFQSDIRERVKDHVKKEKKGFQGSLLEREFTAAFEQAMYMDNLADPIAVTHAIAQALFDDHPKSRYMVSPDQQTAEWCINAAIQRVVELNHDHVHSYDRDTLVDMLTHIFDSHLGDKNR